MTSVALRRMAVAPFGQRRARRPTRSPFALAAAAAAAGAMGPMLAAPAALAQTADATAQIPAAAHTNAPPATANLADTALCHAAIRAAEAATGIPDAFLRAIGRVESGRADGDGGRAPWPWTINAAGTGHFYASRAEAIAAARAFQASGIASLDIGCLQVNLAYHPAAFGSLEQAFDPAANATYAARLLLDLKRETGSWPRAAAAYHSHTPALGRAYQEKVLAAWAEPDPRLPYRARDEATGGAAQGAAERAQDRAAALAPAPGAVGGRYAARGLLTPPANRPILAAFGRVSVLPRVAAPGGGLASGGRSLASYRALPVRPPRLPAAPPVPPRLLARPPGAG